MFPLARLKLLHDRKQQLLMESENHRRLLKVTCGQIHERLSWLDRVVTTARSVLPWCGLAIPLWSIWKSRRESPRSWTDRIIVVVPLLKQFARSCIDTLAR
jgi:hypothetical protein